jgi:hypothetical protein
MSLIAGAGHSVPGDNPDDFTEAVLAFLSDLESGDFKPEAQLEPLPLEELVDTQSSRRRPSATTAIVAAAAAVVALGGVGFLVRRNRKKKAERRRLALRQRAPSVHMPSSTELEATRERMSALAVDLAAMGRHRAADAVHALRDADLTPARQRAAQLSSGLGRRAALVPDVARRVGRKKLRKRSRRAAGLTRAGALLMGQLMLRALAAGQKRQSRRRKGRRWSR